MPESTITPPTLVPWPPRHGRALQFGYRVHVIVRETEAEARAAARKLMSNLDAHVGEGIRNKSLDRQSFGVVRQQESGYPHATECDLFSRHVLPKLAHAPLARELKPAAK